MKARVPILVAIGLMVGLVALTTGCDATMPYTELETPGAGATNTPRIIVSQDATATALALTQSPGPTTPSPTSSPPRANK